MPQANRVDYLTVDSMPPGGLTVSAWARRNKKTVTMAYYWYKKGEHNIVLFGGTNMVVNITNEELIAGHYARPKEKIIPVT